MSSTWPKVRAPEDGSLTWIKPNIYTDYYRSSIKSHTTNTNPTPPLACKSKSKSTHKMDLSSNPSKTPTQWDQNSHTSLSCATKRKYFCNRIMWWVRVLGGGDGDGCTVYWEISRPERKERERERTVSQKPRVGRNDHSVVGQAHRGEHHQNKVPTQSRQPRAASNSDNALNQGPYRVEGLPNQDLMIKIISSCQKKTNEPLWNV
jgi:hypothetical protein